MTGEKREEKDQASVLNTSPVLCDLSVGGKRKDEG